MRGCYLLCWYILVYASCFVTATAVAQNTSGITNQPDTSFTNYSAYVSAKKKFPQIQWVSDSLPESVKMDKGITYLTVNNQNLQLDVFYPKKRPKKLLPAVVIIHGGGWRSGNRTQHYALAQRLAEKGFVCFTPSYSLSTQALYPAAVQDLKAAVRWVRTRANHYKIDTGKIAALGFSAGGHLAALIGTTGNRTDFTQGTVSGKQSDRVQAIVDIDGTLAFIHPESGEGDDSKKLSAATLWFGYNKTEKPELWNQASALTHAGPQTPPTLFINSAVDRMHAGREDYIHILNQHHVYTEVHTFPDTPHTFCLFEPWFTPTVNYIEAFLNKVFK